MYHAGTSVQVKKHIIGEFSKQNSHVRILISTVAFGMGINCKGVDRVVHFGPSESLQSYVQKTGRAGRENQTSICHVLYNGFLASRCSDDMKKFLYEQSCRRQVIKNVFPGKIQSQHEKVCCDLCAKECTCTADECRALRQPFYMVGEKETITKTREVSETQREVLKNQLEIMQSGFSVKAAGNEVLGFPNILYEFNRYQIDQVLQHANHLFTLEDIMTHIEVWRSCYAKSILLALSEVFGDIDDKQDITDESFSCSESDSWYDIDSQWQEIRDDSFFYIGLDKTMSTRGSISDASHRVDETLNVSEFLTNVITEVMPADHAVHS